MADLFLGKANLRTPILTGIENYNRWKGKRETHLSRDPLVLRVVQKGLYEFINKDIKAKIVDALTQAELTKLGYNGKERSLLIMRMNQSEYDKVSSLKSTKNIWDAFESYHEGSKSLRKVKLRVLMNLFENFKLEEGESIKEAQTIF